MAKMGIKNRSAKRVRMAARDAQKRAALKVKVTDETLSFAERMDARDQLNKLPKNGSQVRLVSRCVMTGRPKAVYRKFRICRNKFRELASRGDLPGVTKASW